MWPTPARTLSLLAISAAAAAAPARMAPWAHWQTLATPHYRIHFPPPLADWAREVAGGIEGIHDRVTTLVGYQYPGPIQVLLADPVAEANGLAVPLLAAPHVVLWRTEPESDSVLGTFSATWSEVLLAHELTHIHHLTRPVRPGVSTSPFQMPVGPLAVKAPRWVYEGYATLVEGRVTGSGRPHSALRAAVLRQWARTGKLPAYADLDRGHGFLGGIMAYLVGSAYLEWLERQRPEPPDPLQRLWKQLASRRHRSFPDAFRATFGFAPQDGYQRFQAEVGHDALEWEARLRAQGLREGALWLRVDGGVSDLGVSPDGKRLLARLETTRNPGLAVWGLAAGPAPAPARAPAADPFNGVADLPPEFPKPALAARLPTLDHIHLRDARWLDDGSIGFRIKRPDREGILHPVPGRWRPGGGVEMEAGDLPPAAAQVLVPLRRQGRWVLEWDGQEVPLPGPPVGRAWVDAPRSVVFAACELAGFWNLVRVPYQPEDGGRRFGPADVLTRTPAAAWNPAPTPDGRWLFYTSLDARGVEIRKLDLGQAPLAALPAAPVAEPALADPRASPTAAAPVPPDAAMPELRILAPGTVVPPPPGSRRPESNPPSEPAPLPAATPYRAADNLWIRPAAGLGLGPAGSCLQVGLAGSDLLGRLSWQVLAGLGDGAGPRGAALGLSSAAWAWQPSAALFSVLERPSRQRFAPASGDRERRGGELALAWDDRGPIPFWISPAFAWEQVRPQDGGIFHRGLAGLRAGARLLRARGPWGVQLAPALQAFQGFTSAPGGHAWHAWRGEAALRLETPLGPAVLLGERGALGGNPTEAFTLGGTASSLVPASLDLERVEQAALPSRTAAGDRFLRWRCELGGRLHLYGEGTALWQAGADRGPFQRVVGLEATLASGTGSSGEAARQRLRVQVGVHRPLDGVMDGRTVATVTVLLRP